MAQVGIHNAPPQARREPPREADAGAGSGSGSGSTSSKELKLEVTPTAVAEIRKLDEKRRAEGKAAEGLRIGLRGGGCDGFSYLFEWSDRPAEARDRVFEFEAPEGDGYKVRIFVDPKSLLYLQGTTLNFITGMMGHGFKFENPNVKGSCGCGESVHF